MIELRNINFRYAGGTDAGRLMDIDLPFQTVRLSYYVGNLDAEKRL